MPHQQPEMTQHIMQVPSLMPQHAGAASPQLLQNRTALYAKEKQKALCPELLAACRYFLSVSASSSPPSRNNNKQSSINVSQFYKPNMAMVQLVGHWEDPIGRDTMMQVFQHNQHIVESTMGIPAIALTTPPPGCAPLRDSDDNTTRITDANSPAFWKMKGVAEACQSHDLVWFMDADVIIMEPYVPIVALWFFYKQYYPNLDLLLARDGWSVNTGVWIVDCQSPTARKFLDLWHTHAHQLAYYRTDLMEQVFLYYVLEVGNVWKYEVPSSRPFKRRPMPPWNNFSNDATTTDGITNVNSSTSNSDNGVDIDMWSTQVLRERLVLIDSQCEMMRFSDLNRFSRRKGYTVWRPGDVAVHLSGLRTTRSKERWNQAKDYMNRYNAGKANSSRTGETLRYMNPREVAQKYIERHQ